jgi:cation transport ATPase
METVFELRTNNVMALAKANVSLHINSGTDVAQNAG